MSHRTILARMAHLHARRAEIDRQPRRTCPATVWEEALVSREPQALLKLNAYHLSQHSTVAPTFADLLRELRFADLGDDAKAAFIAEVLVALSDDGADAAREQCRRSVDQLRAEYARRHPTLAARI